MDLMTLEHPRWNEFIDILLGPRGCNVRVRDVEVEPCTWDCDNSFRRTEAILESMGGFDVKASLNHLDKVYKVRSDCQILAGFAEEKLNERWDQGLESHSWSLRSKDSRR